jgi:osmotically-inducible protein OsmY
MRDHALAQTVADALAADPRVDDDTIAVECLDGGHVVLRGSAGNPAEATRALRTAYGVAAVRDVEDYLRPRPPGVRRRHDARTEAAVVRALIADGALPAETIHVSASDGAVTLNGSVEFHSQREAAEDVAMRVPGVSQLRNRLNVWIAVSPNEVLERVAEAIGPGGADRLTVTTRDNVVTLRGTVGSAADRDAALAAAAGAPMVAGVEDEIRVVA